MTYSVRLMRRDRIPTLAVITLCWGHFLIFASYYGALWIIGKEISVILAGICFLSFLFCVGLYLLATDEKRLLRKTLYGNTLLRLAARLNPASQRRDVEKAAKRLMDEIDQEAVHMLYECSGFALTKHWIILYQRPVVSSFLKGALKAYPIPRRSVGKIRWEAVSREENSGFLVRIWEEGCTEDPHRIITYDQATIQALRQWGAELQERREL